MAKARSEPLGVARLLAYGDACRLVRVPGVQARRPCEEHVDAYHEEQGSCLPGQLHG